VALAAVEALGRIGGHAALDCLLELAEGRNFSALFRLSTCLGRSGDARVLPTLLSLAGDPLYGVEAVRALGRLGDPTAVPPLVDLLSRANESLRALESQRALIAIHEHSLRRFGTGIAVERVLADSPRLAELRRQLTSALKRADTAEQIALSQTLAFIG